MGYVVMKSNKLKYDLIKNVHTFRYANKIVYMTEKVVYLVVFRERYGIFNYLQ